MVFNSIQFAIFLPLVFAIYWLLRRNLRLQNLFVVIASYVFYGWWNWRFLILIAFTSLMSWATGLLIGKHYADDNSHTTKQKLLLLANVAINLIILVIFKYYNFFVNSFCDLFGLQNTITLNVILPVGISFYTFQALSYSIDAYRGKLKPVSDIVAFFAFVSFFPQLVAGPIERATNLLPQFQRKRAFDYTEAVDGLRRILWGLFKKMVIADNCAVYVDAVWSDYANQNASTLALAAILFSFQIYGDFSGYSDIAIGSAKLFGIQLKDNFLMPYFSRNMAEFWKRWHISLNTWFVDYLYIPLGGSRGTRFSTIRNTFVIFLVSGLWHGANWTYIIWGGFHALLFVPLIIAKRTKTDSGTAELKQIPAIFLTFALVSLGWIIFRAPDITTAWSFIHNLVCFDSYLSNPMPWLMTREFYIPLFISFIILIIVEWIGRNYSCALSALKGKNRWLQATLYYLLIIVIYTWQCTENIQFIYFQF